MRTKVPDPSTVRSTVIRLRVTEAEGEIRNQSCALLLLDFMYAENDKNRMLNRFSVMPNNNNYFTLIQVLSVVECCIDVLKKKIHHLDKGETNSLFVPQITCCV